MNTTNYINSQLAVVDALSTRCGMLCDTFILVNRSRNPITGKLPVALEEFLATEGLLGTIGKGIADFFKMIGRLIWKFLIKIKDMLVAVGKFLTRIFLPKKPIPKDNTPDTPPTKQEISDEVLTRLKSLGVEDERIALLNNGASDTKDITIGTVDDEVTVTNAVNTTKVCAPLLQVVHALADNIIKYLDGSRICLFDPSSPDTVEFNKRGQFSRITTDNYKDHDTQIRSTANTILAISMATIATKKHNWSLSGETLTKLLRAQISTNKPLRVLQNYDMVAKPILTKLKQWSEQQTTPTDADLNTLSSYSQQIDYYFDQLDAGVPMMEKLTLWLRHYASTIPYCITRYLQSEICIRKAFRTLCHEANLRIALEWHQAYALPSWFVNGIALFFFNRNRDDLAVRKITELITNTKQFVAITPPKGTAGVNYMRGKFKSWGDAFAGGVPEYMVPGVVCIGINVFYAILRRERISAVTSRPDELEVTFDKIAAGPGAGLNVFVHEMEHQLAAANGLPFRTSIFEYATLPHEERARDTASEFVLKANLDLVKRMIAWVHQISKQVIADYERANR